MQLVVQSTDTGRDPVSVRNCVPVSVPNEKRFSRDLEQIRSDRGPGSRPGARRAGGARAGQNLVLNGGFESTTNGPGQIGWDTSVTDWSTTSYSFIYGAGTADTTGVYSPEFGGSIYLWGPGAGGGSVNNGLTASSPDGGNFLSADGSYNNTTISQTIGGLTAGDTYQVGFWWAGAQQYAYTGVTNDYWTVGFGSETQVTPTVPNPSGSFTGWMHQTMTFTADSTSDVLSFFATGAPGVPPFLLLDGVTLNAVPEPSTMSLMVVGALGLGAVYLRRRARKSAAI